MTEAPAPAAASPPLRILLVEDDEFDVAVFVRAFRKSDIACEIVRCQRGEQVLAGLRDTELCFDLLVTDHQLPGMSGYDLCVQLLEDSPSFALVLLTGGGSEQMAIRALRAGINEYIVKDSSQKYLDLLPLVLPKVARRHRERRARMMTGNQACGPSEPPGTPRPAEVVDSAGLGLSDCATVVSRRGGRIWIEQSDDKVPMLHFAVPLAKAEAEAWTSDGLSPAVLPTAVPVVKSAPERADEARPGDAQMAGETFRHALIVHPNPIVTFVTTRILDRLGYRSATVVNGRKALEALEREPFDLVLTGLAMPELDGLDTAREIRARELTSGDHLPIIALAIDPEEDLEKCHRAGIDTHVERPIGFEALNNALARMRPPR